MATGDSSVLISVGHGAAALLVSDGMAVAIDVAGSPAGLRAHLRDHGEPELTAIVVTHLHADHAPKGAILGAMQAFKPKYVFVNPFGATSHMRIYNDIAALADELGLQVVPMVYPATTKVGGIQLRAYWPSPDQLTEAGFRSPEPGWTREPHKGRAWAQSLIDEVRRDPQARRAAQMNEFSVVVVAEFDASGGRMFFGGDIESSSLASILELLEQEGISGSRLLADVVEWPHHGGHPGDARDGESFGANLTELTHPQMVHFSTGTRHPHNPRPEVVMGIRSIAPDGAVPGVEVCCSGLSFDCWSDDAPTAYPGTRAERHCAGHASFRFGRVQGEGPRVESISYGRSDAVEFRRRVVPRPLCHDTNASDLVAQRRSS